MTDKNSISIAILTARQDDVAAINGTLRDAGHAAHCHWVDQPSKLADTLSAENVELIIQNCDSYPESIRQVIKQKDRFNPEIPVIGLKTEASETDILEAMRLGACDLVSMGLRDRLQSVVSRELRALRVERALNATLHSVTEYKRQLNDHLQASTSAIAIVQEGIVVSVNDVWLGLFKAANSDEVVGLPLMDHFDSESQAAVKGAIVATLKGKWKEDEKLAARSSLGDRQGYKLELEFRKIEFDGEPCVQIRVTKQEKDTPDSAKRVQEALKRDPTTLFFHRTQFLERLTKRLRTKPLSGLHALAYIKPDDFADVCDRVGILNSEEILAQFAETIRKRMHPRDIAGRFEGRSIMILLERGNAADAETWGRQLVEHIGKKTFEVGDKSTQLTCTMGICVVDPVFETLEQFVAATIAAFQVGKDAGGNTAKLGVMAGSSAKQRENDSIWIRHLKSALMNDRFRLAQLPIAGLRSDSVRMYDLLVRMLDEEGNSILPSEFLPAAERNNMMKNIDRWMISGAIDFCGQSKADRVFVRLSRQSIVDSSTVTWMDQEFARREFDGTRLVAQIPERHAAEHIKQTTAIAKSLKKIGIGFALEHFGIEQERFQILDLLRPDYIKIDGQAMHSLATDSKLQQQVGKVVAAATERGIKTIAERVENANAMAVLFQLGLDYMQGHYVHEPEVVLSVGDTRPRQSLASLAAASSS